MNCEFALSLDKKNTALQDHYREVCALLENALPTLPCDLGLEKIINPFLRVDNHDFLRQINMQELAPHEVFAKIRKLKDEY